MWKIAIIFVIFSYSLSMAASACDDRQVRSAALPYLHSIQTFRASFEQIDSNDDSVKTGTILIARPGKALFNYRELPITMAIKDGWLTYYDRELNEYQYSILNDSIYNALSASDDVSKICFLNVNFIGNEVALVVQDLDSHVKAEFYFNKHPVFLKKFVIHLNENDVIKFVFHDIVYNQSILDSELVINPAIKGRGG